MRLVSRGRVQQAVLPHYGVKGGNPLGCRCIATVPHPTSPLHPQTCSRQYRVISDPSGSSDSVPLGVYQARRDHCSETQPTCSILERSLREGGGAGTRESHQQKRAEVPCQVLFRGCQVFLRGFSFSHPGSGSWGQDPESQM